MVGEYEKVIASLRAEIRTRDTRDTRDTCDVSSLMTDEETFLTTLAPESIISTARSYFKPYFLLGQRGLAVFTVDYLLRRPDARMCVMFHSSLRTFQYAKRDLPSETFPTYLMSMILLPLSNVIDEVYADLLNETNDLKRLEKVKKTYESIHPQKLGQIGSDFMKELALRIQIK